MDQKALIAIAAVAVLLIAGIGVFVATSDNNDSGNDGDSGNDNDSGNDSPTEKLKDFVGQPVVPVKNLDKGIVAVGQDTFRWVTMFGLANKCVMVDQNDMSNFLGKSFMYNGRAQVDIANSNTVTPDDETRKHFTHSNCAITTEDVSTIIKLNPSIVVVPASFYSDFRNEMKSIEDAGINTVAIENIYTFLEQGTFKMTSDLVKQIDVLSAALDQSKRGDELKAAFDDTVKDIQAYSSKIKTQRTGYIGSVAYNGPHNVSSSMAFYLPMELAGVKNILSGTADYNGSGVKEYSAADIKNKMTNETILFLDASGYSKNLNDNTSTGIFQFFAGHEAHMVMPYIWTGINFDSVFVDALMIMHYAYGDDVITQAQADKEIEKIYERFYGSAESTRNIDFLNKKPMPLPEKGTTILEDMDFVYQTAKNNPIFGDITVNSDGSLKIEA